MCGTYNELHNLDIPAETHKIDNVSTDSVSLCPDYAFVFHCLPKLLLQKI